MNILKGLMILLCTEIILFCMFGSFILSYFHCFATLMMLNFLLLTLFCRLEGSLIVKIFTLSIGNILAVSINWLFSTLTITVYEFFRFPFSGIINIGYPILSIMWIVPFWSLSLTLLAQTKTIKGF